MNLEENSVDIVITTNSPGELSGWVKPVVKQIRLQLPQARTIIFIPPCRYASGMEFEVARNFPEVNLVINPRNYLKFISRLWPYRIYSPSRKGVVIFLGGDLFHAVLISQRLHYPAFVYCTGKVRWEKSFYRFFVPHENQFQKLWQQGIPREKITIIGDLMVDGVEPETSQEEAFRIWHLRTEKKIISFFPGSRPFQVRYLVPFYLKVAEMITQEYSEVQFLLSRSPFIPPSLFEKILYQPISPVIEGETGKIYQHPNYLKIITPGGIEMVVIGEKPHSVANISDLIITIPGTNTAEIACLGIPMIVIAPLNKPEEIPLEGLLGYVDKIPWVGKSWKRYAVYRLHQSLPFVALPNIRAGRYLVPEIRGVIKAESVVKEALDLLRNPKKRQSMSQQLKAIMGEKGAASRLVKVVSEYIKDNSS